MRNRAKARSIRQGESPAVLEEIDRIFDPDALTIGFARRFATYKRATLIFRDMERFERIMSDPERPVQLMFSGKATSLIEWSLMPQGHVVAVFIFGCNMMCESRPD